MTKQRASEMTFDELYQYVVESSITGDPDLSLGDWLGNGDISYESADDVVKEWDEGRD